MWRHPIVLSLALGGVLVAAGLIASSALVDIGGRAMGVHGIVAMIGAAVLMLLLAVGLMSLVFYSNRSGHDREAHESQTRIATSQEARDLNADDAPGGGA